MSNVQFTVPYAPSQAEDGKFVAISPSYLESTYSYPTTGSGRFAVLVKVTDPVDITSTINVTGISVDGPITIGGSLITLPVSVTNVVMVSAVLPNTTFIASDLYSNTLHIITPPAQITTLELYNNSNGIVWFAASASSSYDTLTAKGLPILSNSFYSLDRYITSFVIAPEENNSDIRIIGHYRG